MTEKLPTRTLGLLYISLNNILIRIIFVVVPNEMTLSLSPNWIIVFLEVYE